ncbi:MAG: alpha/beta hydrolase [Clostridia bacterium]|nr:alpha/beta hydrolase [Clostridia bacterium]
MAENKKKGDWGGAALAVGAVAALATVGLLTVTDYVLKLAIDRKQPAMPKGLMGRVNSPEGMPSNEEIARAKQWVLSQPQRTVHIRSRDGLRLVGHWLPAKNAKRTILMMHGWRSNWLSDFCMAVPFMLENGCNLLMVEQRGQGASEGKYIGFGVLEQNDCLDWIHYLTDHLSPHMPIYLDGISMGATTVLMVAGHPLPSNVRGIIADCGFTSPYAIISCFMKTGLPKMRQDLLPLLNVAVRRRAGYSFRGTSTVDALRDNTKPVLFVHGEADTFVPMAMTLENYKACRAPKELLLVEGAGHGLSYLFDTEHYQAMLLRFFEKYDH